jgi:hypothetical protein
MCPAEQPDQEPDAELIREVYARFGAAYYFSEVLHRGLSNAYVIAPFEKSEGVTGPRIDERMANAFSLHDEGTTSRTTSGSRKRT